MSNIDDCASQEIETCTSSPSTRNSRKHSFVQSILNIDRSRATHSEQGIVINDKNPILPLDKHEYIRNWILTHNENENSPQKIYHASPAFSAIQSNSSAKRAADSYIHNYESKRVRRDINGKENFRVSPNGQSRQSINVPLAARRTVAISNETARDEGPTDFMNVSNNDSDKTCMNSPVLNGNPNSLTFENSGKHCKIAEQRIINRRESRGSSIIPESLSSSSPFRGRKSSEIDEKSTKQLKYERRNGTSDKISWISAGKSPFESETKRALKNDCLNLNRDTRKLLLKSSAPSNSWIKDTTVKKDSIIDEQDRLSRRISCLRETNIPMRIESRSVSTNSNPRLVCLSSNLLDTLSISSPIGDSDRIEVESSITNPGDDEMKIESDSEDAASCCIENVETQYHLPGKSHKNICKIEDVSQVLVERGSKNPLILCCDPDETYYSDGDPASRLQNSASPSSLKISEKISQSKSDIAISQVSSPLVHSPLINDSAYVAPFNTPNGNNQKKKKAKKGSLLAKLQNLVSSQISGLRIWRHQMSQPEFKQSCTTFVTFRVRDRETRWGRHYITASLIADAFNLLEDLSVSQCNSTSQRKSSFGNRTVTLMIVPEVTGLIKIRADSSLNVYPPWDIIDRDRRILNITHFDVVANLGNADPSGTAKIRMIERVIHKFDCPCIEAGTIVDSCTDKFTERKPSVMRALFDS